MTQAAYRFDRGGTEPIIDVGGRATLGAVMRPVPFGEAIRWARARKVVLPDVYYGELQGFARSKAFSIAGITSMAQLQAVHKSLGDAMQQGLTFRDWQARVRGGDINLDLPRHRLETIFRTNIQVAYGHGRGVQQRQNAKRRPFLMYDAVNDARVRPAHKAMDGFIAPINDPIWKTHTPPLGYNCRCTVIALTEEQARRRGYPTARPEGAQPDPGWDYDKIEDADQAITRARERAQQKADRKLAEAFQAKNRVADALDPRTWREIPGTQLGSNPASQYEAPDGSRYYVKFYRNPDQARSEVLSARVYEQMGVETLRPFLVTIGKRTGLATRWRDDLAALDLDNLAEKREDLARVFGASVVTKNWDAVGLDYDNLRITPEGRVIIVDTGASFRFRAQGGDKEYGGDINEVRTFLDPARNQQSARVWGNLFTQDVWLEQRGVAPVKAIDTAAIEREGLALGMAPTELRALLTSLEQRRAALVDRYDLDNQHMPAMYQPMLDEFKTWGTERIPADRPETQEVIKALVRKFGSWLNKKHGAGAGDSVRTLFGKHNWSGSSTSIGAGAMKQWASQRFGVRIGYHDGTDEANNQRVTREHLARVGNASGRGEDGIMALLDAEYAFHQAYLRRIHGWDRVQVDRGMSTTEVQNGYDQAAGIFTPNALASTTTSESIWHAEARMRMQARVEQFVKTWLQGKRFMHYGKTESEYIIIGRPVPAKRVR